MAAAASYWAMLAVLIALTVADAVLCTIMFDMFTERYAIFLNQATAFVYIVVASILLLGRRFFLDASHGGNRTPWLALIAIGLFNGTGNTAQALGLPHTPGLTQSLLNLLNLPLVLLLAWAFLRKRPSAVASIGAALIVAGAACSALRSLWQSDSAAEPVEPLWYAIVLYLVAQLFFSGERVFEEHVFGSRRVDPLLMFWVTLVTQFCLGWALLPIQAVRALGGLDLAALPDVIADGVLCTLGRSSDAPGAPACSLANTAVFFAYVAVDFSCYLWGLVVIRRGGAGLMTAASTLALPLQQLVLCLPFLVGKWAESFFAGDAVALAVVLGGFCVFQFWSREGRAARRAPPRDQLISDGLLADGRLTIG